MATGSRTWKAIAAAAALIGLGAGAVLAPATPAGAAQRRVEEADRAITAISPLGLSPGAPTGGPANLVDPIDGTAVGETNPGNVSEYPGASVPLGMVQFSPDTSPDRGVTTGSGYDYADSRISGFSLTHLSGDGCAIYGDVPILPLVGTLPTDPDNATQPFSHADEKASAGNYAVSLGGGGSTSERIGVRLTATTRTALGAFSFPAPHGSGGADADSLLFKVGDSANGSSASQVRLIGTDALSGSVTSGDFCGIPGNYTVYFTAEFSQNFVAGGTWRNDVVGSQHSCVSATSAGCGAWVTFRSPKVLVKVGISFVSAAGAAANLRDEDPGWNLQKTSGAATAEWNGLLDRIAVSGGSRTDARVFYTALYHSLLFPSVFSDDDGRYMGFDHKVHRLPPGQVQYSNISECDIYRTEVPLLATLLPGPTSQMVQSLLRDASQTKGDHLPKWVIADNDASEWDGDSVDPIIADAYAYGARQFDVKGALSAMIRGATVPQNGLIVEREDLQQYVAQGWVPQLTYDLTSYPYTDGGSETLEYSVDDFAISQLADALGKKGVAATFAIRAQNWENLFDPATGYLAARTADGSFPPGPAFQPASPAAQLQGIAQEGFEEGNAIQYTWAVPQNLAGLFGLMGGDSAAVTKLISFFTQINATRFAPYDWAGNEPSMSVPYDYDYAGEPWATQSVVRRIMTALYPLAPAGEPGEDDLGALSSWYVWSALGLYPETPGVADLAMTSPLFPKARITEGNGHSITVIGTHAPDRFIRLAHLALGSGPSLVWDKPWIPASALEENATLSVELGARPNKKWGAAAADAPPSFSKGAAPAVPFTSPGGATTITSNGSATIQLGVQESGAAGRGTGPEPVLWHVADPGALSGVTVSPTSGTIDVVGGRSVTSLRVSTGGPGDASVTFDLSQGGKALPDLTFDVDVSPAT
jgi:predicted alpha-1,2-mannosidase